MKPPAHLARVLRDAAAQELEMACDGEWSTDREDRVIAAVHLIDALHEDTATPDQLATLAEWAAVELQQRAGELLAFRDQIRADQHDEQDDPLRLSERLAELTRQLAEFAGRDLPSETT